MNSRMKEVLEQVKASLSAKQSKDFVSNVRELCDLLDHEARIDADRDSKYEALQAIGKTAAEHIKEEVAALECDYERLADLRSEREVWLSENAANFIDPKDPRDAARWSLAHPDEADELAELEEAAGEFKDADQARERINDSALDIEVRSDWHAPGNEPEDTKPTEFTILLGTGGPAVRIKGELNEHCEPERAWLETQDWGTKWTQYVGGDLEQDTLLTFASCFYFGE